jgi:hypothetical protein
MGLLSYIQDRLPKPSEKDLAELRDRLQKLRRGGTGSYGLLGPSEADLAQMRKQQAMSYAEPPSPWVSIGRGATDLWEPVKQAYLDATDPAQAQAYRQQRAEDERLYQRGLRWANPDPNYVPSRDDFWRSQAHQIPLLLGGMIAPAMSLPEMGVSAMATQNVYDGLNALRRQLGIGE